MPMPMPESHEDHGMFMRRCMGDSMMNGEFPDVEQRRAVCEKQWEATDEAQRQDGSRGDDRLMILTCLSSAAVKESNRIEPLVEIKLMPWGSVLSTNGDFVVDEESAAAIERTFTEHGTDLPIDYEHQTLGGQYASPTGQAPAAGWIRKLRAEKGVGIFASVEWTEKARSMIRAGEYRYLSPVMIVRKSDRKAVGLHSAALTNKPAIERMERIAAKDRGCIEDSKHEGMERDKLAAGQRKDGSMNELVLIGKDLGLAEADCTVEKIHNKIGERRKVADAAAGTVEAVCKALGLNEDAGETELLVAINSQKQNATTAEATRTELAALKDKIISMEAQKLIDEAIAAHKINPKATEDLAVCRQLAKEKPEAFTKLMAERKPLVEPGRTNPPEGTARTAAGKEEELIANAVQEHKGDYGAAIVKLQTELKQPYLDQGLTSKAANQACRAQYPTIFAG